MFEEQKEIGKRLYSHVVKGDKASQKSIWEYKMRQIKHKAMKIKDNPSIFDDQCPTPKIKRKSGFEKR